MSHIVKIYALLLGSALLMFGGGLQGLLMSVRGAEEQFSLLALGLIGTGWSVGFVAGSISVPLIVRRVGHVRAYSVMAAMGTIVILLNLLWINDIAWIVLRGFSGFCFAGAAMIVESWLNETAENKNRGTIFSIYVTVNMAASTLGQLAMSVTGVQGYIPFVVGAIAFACAVLPSALSSSPQPTPLLSIRIDLGLLYRTSPVAVIASLVVGITNGTYGTLGPVYGFLKQMQPSEIALLMSIPAILAALAQVPLGRLSDRIDRRIVLISISGLAALVGIVLVVFNPAGYLIFALFGLYGITALPVWAIAVAHANDSAEGGNFAAISSAMLLIYGLGLAIGPVVAAVAMNIVGPGALFMVTALFHTILAGFAIVRMRVRPITSDEGHEDFRAMSIVKISTPAPFELDPRTTEEPDAPEGT